MARRGDFVRVAKGAAKVAQAFLNAEGPVAAQQALRLREHGVGLSYSLRDAVSSAVATASQQSKPSAGSASQANGSAVGPLPAQQHDDAGGPGDPPHARGASPTELEDRAEEYPFASPALAGGATQVNGAVEADKDVNDTKAVDEGHASMAAATGEQAEASKATGKPVLDESGRWAFSSDSAEAVADRVADGGGGDGAAGAARNGGGGMRNSRTRTVPSSPLARVFGFGQLAAGLAMGTVAEAVRQSVGGAEVEGRAGGTVKQYVVSDANAERLAETLCRMRGAALKLGQMLSIQDESVIPPSLAKALDRVRQGADMMPTRQLHRQLEKSLGVGWRSRLAHFDETPIAAASIGQVHRARLLDGTEVAMKIQYPGVADSVESDLTNLQRLVTLTNILPPGLYIEEIIKVAREELGEECDYEKEAANQERFRGLVESDENLSKWASVPRVVPELLSKEVLTTHLASGVPVDQVLPMPQEVRNHVARLMLRCTINELFDWRFMQTDPNWGNFLFDRQTGKMSLIDFGACREYRKDFVDDYLRLVWAAANRDETEIMRVSEELKFLTGDETTSMMRAHLQAGLVVGEPFVDSGAFDFHGSNITARLSQHGDTFMKHRLTPPPQEAYSLHRKLAGAFLMNIKLEATIPCRDILEDVHDRYTYG